MLRVFQDDIISKLYDVDHIFEDCKEPCGGNFGPCSWCGQGNACCQSGSSDNAAGCPSISDIAAFEKEHNMATGGNRCVKPTLVTTTSTTTPVIVLPDHMVLMPAQTRCKKNANIANVEPRGKMKGNLFLKGNATKCQQSCVDQKLCRFAVLTKSGKCTAYTSCAGTTRRFINFQKSDDKIKRMADDTKCVKKANIADIGNGVNKTTGNLGLNVGRATCKARFEEECKTISACKFAAYDVKKKTCTAYTKCWGKFATGYLAWLKVDAGTICPKSFTSKKRAGNYGQGKDENPTIEESVAQAAILQASEDESEVFIG